MNLIFTGPGGPPHLVMTQDVTATSLKLIWSPPEKHHRNGVITLYGLCFQEASLKTSCRPRLSIPGEHTSYDITEQLRPNTEYMFLIFAATASPGWGPSAMIYETTLPAGIRSLFSPKRVSYLPPYSESLPRRLYLHIHWNV